MYYSFIEKLLEEDIRSVKILISQLNVKFIDVEYLDISGRSFLNINKMNDLKDIIDQIITVKIYKNFIPLIVELKW